MTLTHWGAGYVALAGAVCLSAVLYVERPAIGAVVGLFGASAVLHAAVMIRNERAGENTRVGL